MYYPAIITAALFVGIIINDIFSRKRGSIPEHLVLGLVSVTLMVWLTMKNAEIVAWGLLMIPLFILAITFIFVIFNVSLGSTPTTPAAGTAATSTTAGVASNAATTTAATTITPSACTPKQPAATPVPPSGASTTITPSTTC
jgi:hypothetical protein